MPDSTPTSVPCPTDAAASATAAAVAQITRQLSLELAFAEPGSDSGLLPTNSFVMQLEELLKDPSAPDALRIAVACARRWLDAVFDASATFDQPTLTRLGEWQEWMVSAAERWQEASPIPAPPAAWSPAVAPAPSPVTPPPAPAQTSERPAETSASLPAPTPDAVAPPIPEPSPLPSEPELTLNLDADRDILREFINESGEHLQNIEQGVLVLEESPTDADTLNSIFRAFHTFKGSAGFLNLNPIKDLAHELESLLDAARQHKLTPTADIIELILEGGDILKQFVQRIQGCLNEDGPAPVILVPTQSLLSRVRAVLHPSVPVPAPASSAKAAPPPPTQAPSAPAPAPSPAAKAAPAPAPDSTPASSPAPTPVPPVASGSAPTGIPVASAQPSPEETPKSSPKPAAGNPAPSANANGFVKVDTYKLDSLIELVGELVISESMVVSDPGLLQANSRNLARNLAQLRRITSELQRTAMSLRMVPIRSTFQKMNRLVRDIATKQHKQIQLVLSGEDTELDRNIVEEISDPLIHMIRNAADHGVEPPEARAAKGKPALGTIHLRAFHRGGNIVIQIQDDGNGLDKNRILAKARAKGIVRPEDTPADSEIYDLIFAPGFSTAEVVTEVSGRGVGMDVVRRNIEKLRGKVEIDTIAGHGTTFSIYLPLTLAIIDGLIVSVGDERYIIPTLSVRESFRPKPEMISTIHERGEMVNVRGRLSPLLRLHRYFDQPSRITNPSDGIIVVVESGQQTRCMMVDELLGKQEVVIKSLGGALRENAALAGGAVLGDGRVGLILNVDSIVNLSGTQSQARARN